MKPLRVAQVGTGGFGGCRRDLMRKTGLFELVAAYDLNPEALERARVEDGAEPVGSFEQLLAVPGIEAVVISTGAKFHAEQVLAALRRGLHVFVEKPLCATLDETVELLRVQRETGLVVGVGHQDHAHAARSLAIKELLDSGRLGQLATVETVTAHSGGLVIQPGEWRGDPERNPGGMLFQCGCHSIHELMFYFGPIRSVSAMMRYDVHTTQTADVAHCLLAFESGLIGTLSAYHVTPYRHTLNIYGTEYNFYYDARCAAYGDTPVSVLQPRHNCQAETHEPFPLPAGGDDAGNLRSFYRAVREGGEPYPSLRDGARAVLVVFAAETSARTGRTVDIGSDTPELRDLLDG